MIFKTTRFLLLCGAFLLGAVSQVRAGGAPVQIDVTGLKGSLHQNVTQALTLPQGLVRNGTIEKRWLDRYVDKIPAHVAGALEPFGYYRSHTSVGLASDSGHTRILVQVDPGPRTLVRTLAISLTGEGQREEALRRVVREFPLQKGAPLDHQLYEQGKQKLRLEASALGYLKATFTTHTIHIDPQADAADINLVFASGPRFYFGETLLVEDQERFGEEFLRRFLTYRQGDVFSHGELHRSRLGFYAANRFDDVLVVPLIEEAIDQQVPIKVILTPGKHQRLRPGIGYGTNTGARTTLSYRNMQVGETPHAWLAHLTLAETTQFFESSYTIPQAGSSDDNLIGTLGFRREDLASYKNEMIYAEGEQTYGFGRGRRGALALRYLREDSAVGTDDNLAQLLIPAIRYDQRSYDDPLNPRSGYQFRLEMRGSHEALLSDATLGQVLAAGNLMLPLTGKLTLHARAEAATTIKEDALSEIPPSLRFFVGGDNSVRGYAWKSRGPRDAFGDVTGGDSLLAGSIEIEYALTGQWGLALFYDAGSAFNTTSDIEIIEGTGLGVRRYTQIGPIKFDLAYRLDDSDPGVRLHFSVGFDL